MTLQELQEKHDHFVSRVAAMLTAQHNYFESKKRHRDDQTLLKTSISLEAEVKKLVKAEYAEREARVKPQTLFS